MDKEPRKMSRVLVTGATGFLGRYLVERLLEDGVFVKVFIRDRQKAQWLLNEGAEVVVGNLTDTQTILPALVGVDTVFHCAALVHQTDSLEGTFESVNVQGTTHLTEACLDNGGVERFVHVSSLGVLGPVPLGKRANEQAEPLPRDPYGRSKLAAEQVVLKACERGLACTIARPEWIYGVRAPSTIRVFRMATRGALILVGRATALHQPIWVDDVVEGLIRCAICRKAKNRSYHLAGAEAMTVARELQLVAEAVGGSMPRLHIPTRIALVLAGACDTLFPAVGRKSPFGVRHVEFFRTNRAYSIDRAREDLGWAPVVDFESGAREAARELRIMGQLS